MGNLRVVFRLEIGELFVEVGELGRRYTLRDDPPVHLELPPPVPDATDAQGNSLFGTRLTAEDDLPELFGVRMVEMGVDLDSNLSIDAFRGDQSSWPQEQFSELVAQAEEPMTETYDLLRAWARVGGTQQRGKSRDELPNILEVGVLDLDADTMFPTRQRTHATAVFRVHSREEREAMGSMETNVEHVNAGTLPPIAEILLADARALPAVPGVSDPLRDLLLYAIALEVKVKTRLRELASADNLPLVEVVIANPREVTQSPPQLLHKTCLAVTGQSLAKENSQLFREVEKLFKHRNTWRIVGSCHQLIRPSITARPYEAFSSGWTG